MKAVSDADLAFLAEALPRLVSRYRGDTSVGDANFIRRVALLSKKIKRKCSPKNTSATSSTES